MKPIIGIAAQILKDPSDQFIGQRYVRLNEDYIEAIKKAGGIAMVLTDLPIKDLEVLLLRCDGFILSGGWDIDPLLYSETEHSKLGRINRKNDDFFIDALNLAENLGIPILGICKGHQLINVAHGGSLYQDLESQNTKAFHHFQKGNRADYSHFVFIESDSWLSQLYPEQILVNSFHHQAIKKLADDFKISALSKDGVIEAIEHKNKPIFGVQWHPEMLLSENEENALLLMKRFIRYCIDRNEIEEKKLEWID